MKNASKTMFNIGNIFTIILLVLGGLFLLIGIIMSAVGGAAGAAADAPEAALVGTPLIGFGIYILLAKIFALNFVGKAKKELADESKSNKTPFIITIIFGAIADNVFYVLAGIFGLVAEAQQGQPAQVEEKKEEDKAE